MSFFKAPDMPAPPPPPLPPPNPPVMGGKTVQDSGAAARAAAAAAAGSGYSDTLKSGPQGAPTANSTKKMLLGGEK